MKSTVFAAVAAMALGAMLTWTTGIDARGGGGRGRGMGGGLLRNSNSTQPADQKPGDPKKTPVQQTVNKDQLTDKEVEGLTTQADALEKAADAEKGEAKLSKDELDDFEESLDSASFYIWSTGVDGDGKVTTSYGSSFFPVDQLTKLLDAKNITKPQAKVLLTALKTLAKTKLKLNEALSPEERTKLQKQLNDGLAKYYMAK